MTVEKYTEDGSFTDVEAQVGFYKRKVWRPSKYDPVWVEEAFEEYLDEYTREQFIKLEKAHSESSSSSDWQERESSSTSYERKLYCKVPSETSFARWLGIWTSTLFEWREKFPEFADIIERLLEVQKDFLLDWSISWRLNPLIAKLLLSKHGITERTETVHSWSVDLGGFFWSKEKEDKKESLVW